LSLFDKLRKPTDLLGAAVDGERSRLEKHFCRGSNNHGLDIDTKGDMVKCHKLSQLSQTLLCFGGLALSPIVPPLWFDIHGGLERN
jgi:hypothetical protein